MKRELSGSERDLIVAIEEAFPSKRLAFDHPLADSLQGEEPESVRREFAEKDDWTRLEGKWLDQAPDGWSSALSFLSDEAVCFYIPAYLRADIRGELLSADPLFCLTLGFDNATMHARIWPRKPQTWNALCSRRWSRLRPEQCAVVCGFIEWRLKRDEIGVDYAAGEALENYWRKRAAP